MFHRSGSIALLLASFFGFHVLDSQLKIIDGTITAEDIAIGIDDVLYWNWKASEKGIKSCFVISPMEGEMELKPDSYQHSRIKYFGKGFSYGYCGVSAAPLKKGDGGVWVLKVDKTTNGISRNITILDEVKQLNKTQTIYEGAGKTVICGPNDAFYCELEEPDGLISKYYGACGKSVSGNYASNQGLWKCKFATENSTKEYFSYTQVNIIKQKPQVEYGYNESSSEIVIFCNVEGQRKYIPHCLITTPWGESLSLSPGVGTSRYKFYADEWYSENINRCGVIIPKPLLPEEFGSWECDFIVKPLNTKMSHYGGYVIIGAESKGITEFLRQLTFTMEPLERQVYVKNQSSLSIPCHVNASLDYCWYQNPNGKQITGTGSVFGKDMNFGYCDLDNYKATLSDSGEWKCFAGISGKIMKEASSVLQVIVSDTDIVSIPSSGRVGIGETAQIKCIHLDKLWLKYCRFLRPDGNGFTVDQETLVGDYRYYGNGLEKGECGLHIENVKDYDFGNWSCFIGTSVTGSNLATTILLQPYEGLSFTAWLGIAIGSLVAIFGIAFVIIMFVRWNFQKSKDEDRIPLFGVVGSTNINPSGELEGSNGDRSPRRRRPRPSTTVSDPPETYNRF